MNLKFFNNHKCTNNHSGDASSRHHVCALHVGSKHQTNYGLGWDPIRVAYGRIHTITVT